jgi:enoyl-[acyl-carrier-protein] reductase (NADH)
LSRHWASRGSCASRQLSRGQHNWKRHCAGWTIAPSPPRSLQLLAIDWGQYGIQVNGLGPGYFKTELTDALVKNDEFSRWLIARTPSRRWGEVEDLVGAAIFLASEASNFVNGHILYVDGGVTATL